MAAKTDIPYKFEHPWGTSATNPTFLTVPIPVTVASGASASQALGFPPGTATPVGSGGTPPAVPDFNGFGFYVTSWTAWQQMGGPVSYDATLSTAINGYPQGAAIANATVPGAYWVSTVDNNTSDPDTGGGNWAAFIGVAGASGYHQFPSGVILQWGSGTSSTGAGDAVTFPKAFPTACDAIVITDQNAGPSWATEFWAAGAGSKTTTGFALWSRLVAANGTNATSGGLNFGWIAVGH